MSSCHWYPSFVHIVSRPRFSSFKIKYSAICLRTPWPAITNLIPQTLFHSLTMTNSSLLLTNDVDLRSNSGEIHIKISIDLGDSFVLHQAAILSRVVQSYRGQCLLYNVIKDIHGELLYVYQCTLNQLNRKQNDNPIMCSSRYCHMYIIVCVGKDVTTTRLWIRLIELEWPY